MQYYRFKYRLAMQHSFDNQIEHKHTHVIEIETINRVNDEKSEFMQFKDMEKALEGILDIYQHQYLNAFPEFNGNTTIENIGEVLYQKLVKVFEENNWGLARFEISETPLRVYAIVAEEY